MSQGIFKENFLRNCCSLFMIFCFFSQPMLAGENEMNDLSILESVTAQHNFSVWSALGKGSVDVNDFGRFSDRELQFNAVTYRIDYSFNLPMSKQVAIALGTSAGYTDYSDLAESVLNPKVFVVPGIMAGLVLLGSSRNRYSLGVAYNIERWEGFGYEQNLVRVETGSEDGADSIANKASFIMQVFELRVAWETFWNTHYGVRVLANYSSSKIARPLGFKDTLLETDIVTTSYWFGLGANMRFF